MQPYNNFVKMKHWGHFHSDEGYVRILRLFLMWFFSDIYFFLLKRRKKKKKKRKPNKGNWPGENATEILLRSLT